MWSVKSFRLVSGNRSKCFSGIPFLSLWSNGCWQFDLWFLCLSKPRLYIWKFSIQVLLKPNLKDFEHNLTSIGSKHNCLVVWTFFNTAILWNWDENWPLPVLWPLLDFPNLLTYWIYHFSTIIFYFFYLFFNWRTIALQNFVVFCQISAWITHRCTLCPLPLKPPSHLPPHPTPLGCCRALVWVPWVI